MNTERTQVNDVYKYPAARVPDDSYYLTAEKAS